VFALYNDAERHNYHKATFYREQEIILHSPVPPYFLISGILKILIKSSFESDLPKIVCLYTDK